jgi:peptidoglycan L-alanyl-D-glutamate endopeptidase CwlK
MPVDLVGRIDIDRLYLPFLTRLLVVLDACRSRGADYFAVSGYRTPQEQAALYFQGRTSPGTIVTHAQPFESAHNFGLAADLCRDGLVDRRGLQPDWRPESYDILGEEAERAGLVWGGRWKHPDRPHVQFPGTTLAEMRRLRPIYEVGGLTAVFAELDAHA